MMRVFLITIVLLATTAAFAQKGGHGGGVAPTSGGSKPPTPTGVGTGNYGGNYGNGIDPYGRYSQPGFNPGLVNMRTMTPEEERLQRAMQKVRNLQRQKAMLSDTDKMLQLANSIQTDLQAADGKLSPDEVKKAGDIEKLAKNVQRKMQGDN